ncbi:helix-turn-helix domain-containing protein [Kitasatospora indigofera]|uniref:helix-turn-helix domain-containing protein n=1 Tax=Kitasatospora indigofera TaxID=67307 RepID=UPI00369056D7
MPELTGRRPPSEGDDGAAVPKTVPESVPGPAASGPAGSGDRAELLLAMHRLAVGPHPTAALLGWLARRGGRWTALLDADGAVLRASAGPAGAAPAAGLPGLAAEGVALLRSQGAGSARIDRAGLTGWFVAAGNGPARAVLAAVGPGAGPAGLPRLLADAARLAELCRQVEAAARDRERSERADAGSREAVLHLLMIGELPAAHRIAAALGPELPDPVRVRVVEGPVGRRAEIAAEWGAATGDRSWIVPCPVNHGHLIAVSPADLSPGGGGEPAGSADCAVGVSGAVPLRETALGYEQAFHALAAARSAPGRHVVFDGQGDLAPLLGPAGAGWARQLLRPLTEYAPPRRADPGAAELLGTLSSWLAFGTGAVRHLKVHRNTLAARLDRIQELLGLDLERLHGQAAASLALRLRSVPVLAAGLAAPVVPAGPAGLELLLSTPATAHWAEALLRPLHVAGPPTAAASVRAWLAQDARVAPAAALLGISAPALRKRLLRIEELLQRSLLESPSAKYDLWLAERAGALTERPGRPAGR